VDLDWRKSDFSEDTNCVEVACPGASILIRDSKNPGAGHLTFPFSALTHLLEAVR
jgi:hypothetical protein